MNPSKQQLPGSEPDRETLDRVWARVAEQSAPRGSRAWPLAFAAVSAALVVAVVGWWRAAAVVPEPVAVARFALVTLEDGTDLGGAETLVLADGVVRVDASTGPAHVRVKSLTLDAASGRFLVRVAAETVQIEVESGEVRVQGDTVARVLRAGERWEQKLLVPPVPWLPLARAGRFAEAADLLGVSGRRVVAGAPLSGEDRLLFADVAQAAGDEPLALAQWNQLSAADAGTDVRALAAWRRGLKLAQRPGEEAAAAHAFETAVALGLPGVEASVAAQRLADAWARAGDEKKAQAWRARLGDGGAR